jgi:D-alanyl-D-alanine carboxypeptidase
MTEWRIIPSAPLYAVSDDGRVMRAVAGKGARVGRILRHSFCRHGYALVSVHFGGGTAKQRSVRVSRLVCEAFHGPPTPERYEAAHNDGNPANNAPGNLRWASHYENMQDCRIHKTTCAGERNAHAKLTEAAVAQIRHRRANHEGTLRSLAKEFRVSPATIFRAETGQNWGSR